MRCDGQFIGYKEMNIHYDIMNHDDGAHDAS